MDVRRSAGGGMPGTGRALGVGVDGSRRLAVTLALTYVLYLASVRGLASVVVPPENLSLFWLANAVVVVAMLVTERRWWWAVWAVAMAAELTADSLLDMALGVALWWGVVNIGESTLVVLLLERFAGPGELMRTVRSVGVFVAIALAVPAVTGVLGAAGSVVTYDAGWFDSWRAWWFGDALGITTTKDAVAQLEHAAFHDPLTGLPNRLLFMDRLDHSLAELDRTGGMVAVLYVDLDGFKEVNDTLGHDAGDELLVEAAGRLRRGTRPGDTVGRLGGDEFAVVCGGLHGETEAGELVERLRGELDGPAAVAGQPVGILGSIGVATTGHAGDDAADLLREADAAMFAEKAARREEPPGATAAGGPPGPTDGPQEGSTASPRVK